MWKLSQIMGLISATNQWHEKKNEIVRERETQIERPSER